MCFDVDDTILILEWSFDHEESGARDDDSILLEDVGRQDDVCDAGFVFEREKDKPFGGAWALTRDDTARDPYCAIAGAAFELLCGENALLAEFSAPVSHGVRTGGDAGSGVIGG